MGSLPPSDHRSQKLKLCPLRQRHDMIHHLIHGLFFYLFSALGTMRNSYSCIQKTKIVINFRHGSHCGTGISVGGFLVNGNCRRKPFNHFHIRFFHLSQKLSCIGRKRFHVTSLSFCINGIKSQRRFSGSTDTCQNHKFISRNIHAEVFQIIYICPADSDKLFACCMFSHLFLHFLSCIYLDSVSCFWFQPFSPEENLTECDCLHVFPFA